MPRPVCMAVVLRVRRTYICQGSPACNPCMCTNEVLAALLLLVWVMQDYVNGQCPALTACRAYIRELVYAEYVT